MKSKTPTQKMMIWILENFESELNEDVEKDRDLDDTVDKISEYETSKMKEVFIAGIMLGSGASQLKKEFDTDEEFKKLYYKMFPEE